MTQTPNTPGRQLPLSITLDTETTRDNWLSRESTAALEQWLFDDEGGAYIRGETGVGKSHLLQALCHAVDDALYLPLGDLQDMPPMALLEGTEGCTLLAIDELHAVLTNGPWQEALFHLFNRAQQTGTRLVMAANVAPGMVPGLLADLRSRLESLPTFVLPVFSDADLDALLSLRAEQRGLVLSDEVRAYVLRRVQRSPVACLTLLDTLDREALALGRAVTIPLLRELDLLP